MIVTKQHIKDVVVPIDYQTIKLWFEYGINQSTKFPELVVLRGVYLRQLAEQIQAKYLAEVGTARGFQSFIWSQYFIDAGYRGLIYTCDIDGMDALIYKTFFTGDKLFTRKQLWQNTPQSNFIHFVHGTSNNLKQEIINKLDMLYIDGQHSEEAVMQDFQNLSPCLHSGSIIVFDDCDERFPGIQNAVKRISVNLVGKDVQIIEFIPHQYKIAIIRL